jgi:spermidine/putrescine transport system substrate-binding protein
MMRPDIARKNCEYTGCATANGAAVSLLDKKIQADRTVYPEPVHLRQGEFQTDVGHAVSVYEKYWDLLKKAAPARK